MLKHKSLLKPIAHKYLHFKSINYVFTSTKSEFIILKRFTISLSMLKSDKGCGVYCYIRQILIKTFISMPILKHVKRST